MKRSIRKSREVLAIFIVLFTLSIAPVYSEDNSNFEIKKLDINVDIDVDGISLVKEKMVIENTSSEEIHSIMVDISGWMVWDIKAFEDENKILPSAAIKKDSLTYEIKIDVDIKPGKTKDIWLQYLLDRDAISEKFGDFQYVKIEYNFLESKYIGDDKYPLSIRFWAPKGFFIAIYAGDYISENNKKQKTYQKQRYISLIFEENPEQEFTVILRNVEKINKFRTELVETIDFSGNTPVMKITTEKSYACIRLGPDFAIPLPYKGGNFKIISGNDFEFRSNNSNAWLVPKDNIGHFRAGYPLNYVVEYNINDKNFKNRFFTIINREISETREYHLWLYFKEKPIIIYSTPITEYDENEHNDKYKILVYDSRNSYLKPVNYTIAYMTNNQFHFNLKIFLILSIISFILTKKGHFIKLNKDFSSFILAFFISLLVFLFSIILFENYQIMNLISCLFMIFITFMVFFLYPIFSKNLSFKSGIIFGIAFIFVNHGILIKKVISESYFFAIDRGILGEILLSSTGSILVILYYLYKEKKIQEISSILYKKFKIWKLNISLVFFWIFFGLFTYLILYSIAISSISIKLEFSLILFVLFFLFSFLGFYSVIKKPKYRKENGYYLYEGMVSKIAKQENESVCFHLKCSNSDTDNEDSSSEKELEFVYDNRTNYPIFGLSYSQIKEEMEVIVVTRNSDNINERLPMKAWIITS